MLETTGRRLFIDATGPVRPTGVDPVRVVSRRPNHLDQAQSSKRVSVDLRHGGTPETIVASDLVRTHTFPGHDNGPQAELAGR
jgi:hypothetical protein